MVNFQYFQSFWDTLKKYLAGFTKLKKELQTVEAKMDFFVDTNLSLHLNSRSLFLWYTL